MHVDATDVLVDIDGTIAIHDQRGPYDWDKVDSDLPNYPVIQTVRALAMAGYNLTYLTGRDSSCRAATYEWLNKHVGVAGELLMRGHMDFRPDDVIKEEIVRFHFSDLSRILLVIDDRSRVVNMWRKTLGLTCLQVADGDF